IKSLDYQLTIEPESIGRNLVESF
ncbi:hypothetical protein THAOC_10193, partial [Thalassiosira oceanica]